MKANESVQQRVAELQLSGAEQAELTIEELIRRARDIMDKAIAAQDFGAASATLERAAKIGGLWVEKREHSGTLNMARIDAPPPADTSEEWAQQYAN